MHSKQMAPELLLGTPGKEPFVLAAPSLSLADAGIGIRGIGLTSPTPTVMLGQNQSPRGILHGSHT